MGTQGIRPAHRALNSHRDVVNLHERMAQPEAQYIYVTTTDGSSLTRSHRIIRDVSPIQ
jgi:hypothetical protein